MTGLISGEYTVEDYILANRLHMSKSILWKIIRITFAVLLIPFIFFAIILPKEIFPWLFIVFSLYYISYPYTILPLRAKALFKQQRLAHGQIEVRFEGNQIIEKSPLSEGSINWLHHCLISDKIMLLYTTPKTFIMLPRRFFKDDAQFNEVKGFLETFPTGKRMK
jgi:hypothetical protein